MKRYIFPLFAFLVGVLAAGVILVRLSRPPHFNGAAFPEPIPLPEVTLTGATGEPVSLDDFSGKVVLLYFGYTHCRDACPTTMADLSQVQAESLLAAGRFPAVAR